MKKVKLESLEAVHTHTHTHTSRLLINKKIENIDKKDSSETYVLGFVAVFFVFKNKLFNFKI